jgi:L-lysine 2,3-aminomutase
MRLPHKETKEPEPDLPPEQTVPSVSLEEVLERVESFLEHCWDRPLVDWETLGRIRGSSGRARLAHLLAHTGFAKDPEGFASALVAALETPQPDPVVLGGTTLPYHLLLSVMEILLPGEGFKTIKKVMQLEDLTGIPVPDEERADLQRVIDTYPVRLSMHTVRQLRLSNYVGRQYMPFVGELDPRGEVHTWVGQFFRGIVEQMYQNRVIFIMNMACPVYCRFCFRKHKECRNQRSPAKAHVKQAVLYIREAPAVKEIVLTGGDPFMNRATLQYAVQELAKVPHVQTLRLASRAVSYYPEMFLRDDGYWLNYLMRTNLELNQRGKRLELATHFIHPDEISYDALHVISHLVRHGVQVYVQTPFVDGCNETGEPLVPLFNTLRAAGAEIHYIFMPTSPIQGNSVYWSPIAQGLRAGRHLRAHLSDRAVPHITTATSIGKIDWNTSGWAVEPREDDPNRIWIRTPYTKEYYEEFAPILQISDRVRPNAEGTLDADFHTEIGDEELFAGPRGLTSSPEAYQYKLDQTREHVEGFLPVIQTSCLEDQRQLGLSIGGRPCPPLARQHRTRVELDCGAPEADLQAALAYIGAHREITDVVLSRRDDTISGLSTTVGIIERLIAIPHVIAVRLRSLKLIHSPGLFSRAAVARLAGLNRLHVLRPTRLEVETQILHSGELKPELFRVVRDLRLHGITVYNNTPLLGFINDNEEEMLRISSECRAVGIEFNNIYVAGLPVQEDWNSRHPIELNTVVDIATYVRRNGSGREVPRYVLRTALGEVDFSIVPRIFVPTPEGVSVRLLERNLEHFRAIAPDFRWPHLVTVDEQGQPLVPVPGISLENQEFLFAPTVAPEEDEQTD